MKELPTYTPDFEEYIRMKELGTDGFPYERHYGHDHSFAMSFEEHVRRQKASTPLSTPSSTPSSTPANVTIQSANVIENPLSKCKNCTLEEAAVLLLVQKNPSITQKQIATQIGKSERTVKTITVNLVDKGIIIRRNGKRNGYWEIVEE